VQMGGLETHQDRTTPHVTQPRDTQVGLSKPSVKREATDKPEEPVEAGLTDSFPNLQQPQNTTSEDVVMHSVEDDRPILQKPDAHEDVVMAHSVEDQQRRVLADENGTNKHSDTVQSNAVMYMDIDGQHQGAQREGLSPASISPQQTRNFSSSPPPDAPSSQTTISHQHTNGKSSTDTKADKTLSNGTRDTDSPLSDVPSIVDLND